MFRIDRIFLALSSAYTLVVLYFSSLPAGSGGAGGFNPGGDAVHFAAYMLYSVLVYLAFQRSNARGLAASLAIPIMVGALAEIIQLFVPGRSCDFWDWIVDVAGVLAGAVFMLVLARVKATHLNRPDKDSMQVSA